MFGQFGLIWAMFGKYGQFRQTWESSKYPILIEGNDEQMSEYLFNLVTIWHYFHIPKTDAIKQNHFKRGILALLRLYRDLHLSYN